MNDIISVEELRQYISKLERLEDEKEQISESLKSVYLEAKSSGFDVVTIKKIIKLKRTDKDKIAEADALLETYRNALNI